MKILVLEDNYIVSLHLEQLLISDGCEVLGPFATASSALLALEAETVDGALLDFSLRDGDSTPVAAELSRRGCPFAVATGYSHHNYLPEEFANAPLLSKPISDAQLRKVIAEFKNQARARS